MNKPGIGVPTVTAGRRFRALYHAKPKYET